MHDPAWAPTQFDARRRARSISRALACFVISRINSTARRPRARRPRRRRRTRRHRRHRHHHPRQHHHPTPTPLDRRRRSPIDSSCLGTRRTSRSWARTRTGTAPGTSSRRRRRRVDDARRRRRRARANRARASTAGRDARASMKRGRRANAPRRKRARFFESGRREEEVRERAIARRFGFVPVVTNA